ncbi:MAG: DUF4097 family beta strand repeat-containing protein [Acidobacteriota bacterium]
MINRKRAKGLAILLGLAVALSYGAALAGDRERYEEKFEKTEALARDGKVFLSNISGDIVISSWKENQVKIEAVKVAQASSLDKAKENAALVTIEVTREGDALRIETKYPERHGFWGDRSINVSVSYVIRVPEKASIDVRSISGDVKVASIGGAAKVKSISGDVDARGMAGLEADVVSGNVTTEGILGDAYLKSVSGDVRATGIKGSVEMESVSGDLDLKDVSEARTVKGKTVSGDVTYVGTILAGGNYELGTHSGNVEMRIPAASAFDFEANTFSGVIDSDFQIQVMGRISPKEIRGTVNKGGARIRLSSFSGDIELKKY